MVTPKTFVQQVPRQQLEKMLEWAGVSAQSVGEIDFTQKPQRRAEQLLAVLDASDAKSRETFHAAVEEIEQLRDEQGWRALRSVAVGYLLEPEEFDKLEDVRAAAIEVLVRDPRVFERVLAAQYADRSRGGRMWSGFAVATGDRASALDDQVALARFAAEVQEILPLDPPGGRCKVDCFDRIVRDPLTEEISCCVQATIYQEDRPTREPRFEDDQTVVAETRRPVHEGAIIHDQTTGDVDVIAKGGSTIRDKIAAAYSSFLGQGEDNVAPVKRRAVDLARLHEDRTFEIRAEDGVEAVKIERLKLLGPQGSGFAVTLEASASIIEDATIHELARSTFGTGSPIGRRGWRIVQASLRVVFAPVDGERKRKAVKVELGLPNRTNLRNQTERHRLIANTLLERWGLYASDED